VELGLLGPLTITRDGEALELTGPKRRALLILLALHVGRPVSRDHIVESLWPSERSGREESTLRVHVSHLRDVLEPTRDGDPRMVLTHGSGYLLASDSVTLDVARFDALRREGRSHLPDDPARALELVDQALGLWRGRALEDVEYEEFARDEILRLDLARVEAMEDRAEALVLLGEESMAIEDLESQVRGDAARERPVRLLMHALYRTGRQPEALAAGRRHRRALAEMGLEASPAVAELEDRILMHDPGLLPVGAIAPAEIRPGRAIRGYELREVAGTGAIGVVYRAFQPSIGREVAIKVIDRQTAQGFEFIRRFTDEAALVASLEHPHVVPLYDFWRDPLGAFLVMRWMDGGTLADRMDRAWSVADVGRVFGQITDALDHAHQAGVVHRDVKPANVLFDGSGNAYLCDFGLAATAADRREGRSATTPQPLYAAPEALRGEQPTVAADIYALGEMLGSLLAAVTGADPQTTRALRRVADVATAPEPADRYPDVAAMRADVSDAVGPDAVPAPRQVRRNPFKGLKPFDETDHVDFHGRDDVTETLVGHLVRHRLVALMGASGSGKSSLVRAGLVPLLRRGAIPGSDEWAIATMKPGVDPYEEFWIALRSVATGEARIGHRSGNLRAAFEAALEGPRTRCLLIVDQFEELFSSDVDDDVRERFIDDLVDLATEPGGRSRVVVTIRADFADRPLAHGRLGDLLARGSLLVAPIRPDELDDVIRRPAARVGVQVEPGLVAEIARDVAVSPGPLPLLQYVLSELFERRTEDRLTVHAYRALGGVRAVLERQAESTFAGLGTAARQAARQLFLRMVQLGDRGEETRRRLPLDELDGLGAPAAVQEALDAFASVRLLTYDRDPVTRTPTVEVAHEAVISRWTRYRIWIDEARADLETHRRVASAAQAWVATEEDPAFLLSGGPLGAALDVAEAGRLQFNEFESRFVEESRLAAEAALRTEEVRRQHEAELERTARRRLRIGMAVASALVVVAVLASMAWVERRRADTLAVQAAGESRARQLAALSLNSLAGSDHDLGLLLAIAAAEEGRAASGHILDEAVDALHRALVRPRPAHELTGLGTALGGRVIDYSDGGSLLAALGSGQDLAVIVDPATGEVQARIPSAAAPPATGIMFHPDGDHVLTIHRDAVRAWLWQTGELTRSFAPGGELTRAAVSPAGDLVAIGDAGGGATTVSFSDGVVLATWQAHAGSVTSVDFDSRGGRVLTAGSVEPFGWSVLICDARTGIEQSRIRPSRFVAPIFQAAWSPSTWDFTADAIVVTVQTAEVFVLDARSGDTVTVMGNAGRMGRAVAFNGDGTLVILAGTDGAGHVHSTWVGGERAFTVPAGGVPLRDAEFHPVTNQIATITVDGTLRIWDQAVISELPAHVHQMLGTSAAASSAGDRVVVGGYWPWYGIAPGSAPGIAVLDSDMQVLRTVEGVLDIRLLQSSVEISDDGRLIAYVGLSNDGTTIVVPFPIRSPVVRVRETIPRSGLPRTRRRVPRRWVGAAGGVRRGRATQVSWVLRPRPGGQAVGGVSDSNHLHSEAIVCRAVSCRMPTAGPHQGPRMTKLSTWRRPQGRDGE
jgi:serine/threonine protein kinase/DNA-binding SARP family transcriptional activator/WD40 repeat protein